MNVIYLNSGILFCICLAVVLITSWIMNMISNSFYTYIGIKRKFSIFDLQIVSYPTDIQKIISGIYALPDDAWKKSIRSLKANLYVDFLFIPAAYGSIFLVNMLLSSRLHTGAGFLIALAWIQGIAFICDIIENIMLLSHTQRNARIMKMPVFNFYRVIVWVKWIIALTGVMCGISVFLYLWLSGHYNPGSVSYLKIAAYEIAFVAILSFVFKIFRSAKKNTAD